MSITVQPASTTDSTGAALVPAVSITGASLVTNDDDRRIQEMMLLLKQATLLSTQLANDKTARYTFIEVR